MKLKIGDIVQIMTYAEACEKVGTLNRTWSYWGCKGEIISRGPAAIDRDEYIYVRFYNGVNYAVLKNTVKRVLSEKNLEIE